MTRQDFREWRDSGRVVLIKEPLACRCCKDEVPFMSWNAVYEVLATCGSCCGTNRNPMPWSELFKDGRTGKEGLLPI